MLTSPSSNLPLLPLGLRLRSTFPPFLIHPPPTNPSTQLLDVLNSHFQAALNISPSMASGLSSAYFGAYFICPLTISGWILRRYGFRVTFMSGLAILAVGCLLFWPSGVKRSFGGFCGSMFVVGAGLSTLETGADNFLSICGPPKYSEIRLNFAQGFNGIGTFAAPLLASRVFFAKTVDTSAGLANVQWVYLGVAGFVLLLIPLFYLAPMPEVTDADMSMQEVEIEHEDVGPLRKQYNLFLSIWAEFMYVAAQGMFPLPPTFLHIVTSMGQVANRTNSRRRELFYVLL